MMKFKYYFYYGLTIVAIVVSLWPSKYDRIMKPVLELKEKNPNALFDGKPEPPFPDKKKNIESKIGIDINKNGIRDDLEIYANRISKTDLERRARLQLFEALTNLVKAVESNEIEKIRYADDFYYKSSNCHFEVLYRQTNIKDDYSIALKASDESRELFELLPQNKGILDIVSIKRMGEAQGDSKITENVCSLFK